MPSWIMEFPHEVGEEVAVMKHHGPFIIREIRIGYSAEEVLYVVTNDKGGRFHVFEEEISPWDDNI